MGVAVYHVALCSVKCCQKVGARRAGSFMVPLEWRGARKEARRPWMWKRGIISRVRSWG